jgi:serine phosphatase RsbU (regulator of sigma subunit)/pSer/pThr/pTyr-binding forkhead associated (FHA) protein
MAYLEIIKGSAPARHELAKEKTTIGRHPDCNVVVAVGAVSRFHAQILHKDNQFIIEDLKSRNGTYVNGNRIGGPTVLNPNDRVKICDVLFAFHSDASPRKPSTAFLLTVTEGKGDSSTILTTVDASSSASGIAFEVRPEAKLRAVLEISQNVGSILQLAELLPKVLDSLFKIFPQADRGFVLMYDQAANRLVPMAIKNRRPGGDESVRMSRTIVRQVLEKGQAILLADASGDSQFSMSQSIADFRIRSIMCVPLRSTDARPIGILQVHTEDSRQQFTQEDLDLLNSVATIAASRIENAQLHESLLAQERLKKELQFARDVQRSFLPAEWPDVPGYGFFAYYEPANTVGGDYYDFIQVSENRHGCVLADVSGKGVPAALLMARLSSDVRFSAKSDADPALVARRVNRALAESALHEKFVTMLYMALDIGNHELSVANCGHMPPMIRRPNDKIEELGEEQAGLPLNVVNDYEYEGSKTTLEPGTLVLAYTDGVSEAMNPAGDLFGFDRLREAFLHAPKDAIGCGETLIKEVKAFAAGRAQNDDITLIVVARNE